MDNKFGTESLRVPERECPAIVNPNKDFGTARLPAIIQIRVARKICYIKIFGQRCHRALRIFANSGSQERLDRSGQVLAPATLLATMERAKKLGEQTCERCLWYWVG